MSIQLAQSEDEIKKCYPIVQQLRPQLSESDFIQQVKRQQQAGYQLVYVQENVQPAAVAGFRLGEALAWGKFLYVDDLITEESQRSQGHGKALLDWLKAYAKDQGCAQLHLDSGIQRLDAHRFYEREQMINTSFHYAIAL